MITNLWALKGTVVTMPVCRCGGLIQRDHWLYETGLGLGRCLCESGVHCMPPSCRRQARDLGHVQSDHAALTFELHLNLKPLFDWNTKQVFLYLYANYTTSRNVRADAHTHAHACAHTPGSPQSAACACTCVCLSVCYCPLPQAVSQVVLWDKIVLRGENPVIDYTDMNTKYAFFDDGFGLR